MATACPHVGALAELQPPKLSQSVHREECTQCFDSQDSPSGVDVCLSCFNGACLSSHRHHARTHAQKSGHPFTLNVKRSLKPSTARGASDEPPAKMTKIAIQEEREEDMYTHTLTPKCWSCNPSSGLELPETNIKSLADGIMHAMSSARQSEVQAWEEEILPCEHTLTISQESSGPIPASGLAHCSQCDLTENLWLCLTCGSLGCGRQLYGGLGGNGHGLSHYQQSSHPVSVKLGTITPEGNADIYCYPCDDAKLDPSLSTHLSTFGINVNTQTKTEKSMTELQIEHNLRYEFSLTGEDGRALVPVFGPQLTGLKNLGNSCYMASVLQTLFSLPPFQQRYYSGESDSTNLHAETCTVLLPADCLECQMLKLADGLISGRYSHPASYKTSSNNDNSVVFQDGLRPSGFKALVGKGHEEFSTMRQQDSEEFFTYLITTLRRDFKKRSQQPEEDPTRIFSYGTQQRLRCTSCNKVRYRVDGHDIVSVGVPAKSTGKDSEGREVYEDVRLVDCLDSVLGEEALEYSCPNCAKKVIAIKQQKFATFPSTLVIHAKKFQLVNWVPAKLNIPMILPENDELVFDDERYIGRGKTEGEEELPDDAAAPAQLPEFNQVAMAGLLGMGFPEVRCQKALLATGNEDLGAATEWLFSHMDDPDIDAPITPSTSAAGSTVEGGSEPSAEQISMLADMGFTSLQARKALRETGGNAERAVEWLFNHPEDMGEMETAPVASTSPSSDPSNAPSSVGGYSTLPARYRLKAFISHKGPSVHSGHYVAHIKTEKEGWVLFNDEKVVRAEDDRESVGGLKKLAYLYFFERV